MTPLTRSSILASLGIAVLMTACGSEDSPNNSANNTTSANTTNPNTSSATSSSTTGNTTTSTSSATGTTGMGTTGNTTTSTSAGGTSGTTTTGVGGGTSGGGSGGSGGGTTGGTGGGGNNPIAGTDSYDCSAPEGDVPLLKLTEVASGINAPVDIAHPPNDSRLFVITLDGDVMVIKDGSLLPTPFLSLGDRVTHGGQFGDERGLLGIAFHPDYASNGLFYLHYSAGQGVPGAQTSATVIEEYTVSSNPDEADPGSARVVLTVPQPAGQNNHKGGGISFGSDGMMYIGLGDGGGSGDMMGNAQNTQALLGKILRINPVESGGMPYTTPTDNLPGGAPEVWDYGLRNPFRTGFDACTGDFYIGDVGQSAWEEITIEKAGEGHKNYGWNIWEGMHCYTGQTCDEAGITQPKIEIERMAGQSVTGGAVYRGSAIPSLRGAYFYGDFMTHAVWYTRYDRDADTVTDPVSVSQELNTRYPVAIRNGADGELYFITLLVTATPSNNLGDGAIYRLESAE